MGTTKSEIKNAIEERIIKLENSIRGLDTENIDIDIEVELRGLNKMLEIFNKEVM